jgi:hypothetical protein
VVARSRPMIGMPGENRRRPVYLLRRHDSRQLMRPGHGAKGNDLRGLLAHGRVEAIGTANRDDVGGGSRIPRLPDIGGQLLA